jgi:hypothetical protein
MTPEQEKHLEFVIQEAVKLLDSKYRLGQARHGGNLFDKTPEELVDEAIYEAIDQMVYLLTLRQKLSTGRG